VTKRTIIVAAAAAVIGGFILINLLLHFGQKRHDRLGYDIAQAFPPDKPFVPGEIFASVLAEIMEHELHSPFGWRPNDFYLWGPHVLADNNANRQLGIIMAVRESTRVFKDHLTKIPSNEYDQNLVIADTDFRNDAERWILPSPEGKYADGVARLRAYVAGLRATPQTSRPINLRNAELGWLLQSWTDMLGDAHANLYRTQKDDGSAVEPWDVDDYFYHAQGVAYVMYHLMQAVKREYALAIKNKPVLGALVDESLTPLKQAATLKPLVVLDGPPAGIVANHRKNLDAFISEARQKMFTLTDELAR
jgi:hypothetical protein